jgi:hypothetical protein
VNDAATTPARRPLTLRLMLFVYGTPNIAGCALALAGPALLFAGVIGPGWGWITLGLYAAGWVAGGLLGNTPEVERRIADTLTVSQTLEHLDDVIARVQSHLTEEMRQRLASVRGSVAEVLPRLLAARAHDTDLFTVRETVLRYLPETLSNYVTLPAAFRLSHVLKDGKTARQLLTEQLSLLDEKLREIVANVSGADAQALVANGQFLEMKFRQPDFLAR